MLQLPVTLHLLLWTHGKYIMLDLPACQLPWFLRMYMVSWHTIQQDSCLSSLRLHNSRLDSWCVASHTLFDRFAHRLCMPFWSLQPQTTSWRCLQESCRKASSGCLWTRCSQQIECWSPLIVLRPKHRRPQWRMKTDPQLLPNTVKCEIKLGSLVELKVKS